MARKNAFASQPRASKILAAFVYVQDRQYRVAKNKKEIHQLFTSRKAYKART